MKFGLIIQGPLLSIGRGVSSYKKKAETSENEIIKHQCDETIISNIENYGNLFEKIIISTSLDFTYTSEDIIPFFGSIQRVIKILGYKKALQILLTIDHIALDWVRDHHVHQKNGTDNSPQRDLYFHLQQLNFY